jgi:phosphoribosyl 1,2-cyclic phosphodiesterase
VLEITDEHSRMMADKLPDRMNPVIEIGRITFQGISTCRQPVNPVEVEPLHGRYGDMQMA